MSATPGKGLSQEYVTCKHCDMTVKRENVPRHLQRSHDQIYMEKKRRHPNGICKPLQGEDFTFFQQQAGKASVQSKSLGKLNLAIKKMRSKENASQKKGSVGKIASQESWASERDSPYRSTPKFKDTPESQFSLGEKQGNLIAVPKKKTSATVSKHEFSNLGRNRIEPSPSAYQSYCQQKKCGISASLKRAIMKQLDQQLLICAELKYQVGMLKGIESPHKKDTPQSQ